MMMMVGVAFTVACGALDTGVEIRLQEPFGGFTAVDAAGGVWTGWFQGESGAVAVEEACFGIAFCKGLPRKY